MAFFAGQDAGKGRKLLEPLRDFRAVAKQAQQFQKSLRRLARAEENLPPLIEAVRCGMTIGEPSLDVVEGDTEQRLTGGGIGALQFVGDQVVQGFHGGSE